MSIATIVEPTGVPARIEIIMPTNVQITDKQTEHITTERKLLNILMAESAGKIISAEIRSEPTRFIARTTITAIIIAIIRLQQQKK